MQSLHLWFPPTLSLIPGKLLLMGRLLTADISLSLRPFFLIITSNPSSKHKLLPAAEGIWSLFLVSLAHPPFQFPSTPPSISPESAEKYVTRSVRGKTTLGPKEKISKRYLFIYGGVFFELHTSGCGWFVCGMVVITRRWTWKISVEIYDETGGFDQATIVVTLPR